MKLILLFSIFAVGCSSMPKKFVIHGHRGARSVRPENTMAAFKYAVEAGADVLELDLHATKDNVLVITHDPVLNKDICLDGNGNKLTRKILVRSLTLKELQKYDCGSLVNPRFVHQVIQPKEKIPTFDDFLTWAETTRLQLNVETKSDPRSPQFAPEPEAFVKLVVAALKKHNMLKRTILQSFDYRTLEVAKRLEPALKLSALVDPRPKISLVELAQKYKVDFVSPNHEWLTKEDVDSLHAIHVQVVPWTVNEEKDWRRMVDLGVDGIISDDPKGLREFRR